MALKKIILLLFIKLQFINFLNAQSIEYTLKASFIEKFARFTVWPTPVQANYFVINVLGKSPFKGELEKMVQTFKIKDKPIKIVYIRNYNEAGSNEVLFICASEKSKIPEIVKYSNSKNILTISDTPGFCKRGVHFNFYIDGSQTIKYEVNHTSIKESNLVVDMQILNFGRIIR
jgi:hypothetical protein